MTGQAADVEARFDDAFRASWRPVYAYLRHEGDPSEAVRLTDLVRG